MRWIQFPLGDMTAAAARDCDKAFYDAVAAITKTGPRIAKRRISKAAGNTLLRNVFRDEWPYADDIGDLTVSQARELELTHAIALATFLDDEQVEKNLSVRGNTLVRNVFGTEWPTHPDYGEDEQLDAGQIGELTVGEARDYWVEAIADITGLGLKKVQRILDKTNGRTLVRNAFTEWWPALDLREPSEPPAVHAPADEWVEQLLGEIHAKTEAYEQAEPIGLLRDRFELLASLGEGGFGEAFAARDRLVSSGLIVVKRSGDGSTEGVASLKREFANQLDLQHPNICKNLHVDEDPATGRLFLVMQYGGMSIESIIEDEGPLPVAFALDVVHQASLGLHHAHENSVIHHDVSPGNILVDGKGRVRVTDFGVSVIGKMSTIATAKRTVIGTTTFGYNPSYAAPEMWKGSEPLRRAADQYSLALCLCAMLEGEGLVPKYAPRAFARLSSRQNAALARALSFRADDRFSSILDFAEALIA